MSEFKVGEVAIIVGTISGRTDVIGMECIIVAIGVDAFDYSTNKTFENCCVVIPNADWDFSHVNREKHLILYKQHLKKKRPPETTTSWLAVAAATGWQPSGVPA